MDVINEIYDLVKDRKLNADEKSYTKYLFDKGIDKILKKVGEECTEVIIASKGQEKQDIINEVCDLIYHLIVLSVDKQISLDEIEKELVNRRNKINNFKGERKEIINL